MMTAKIRRMSKRRQKIALRRKLRELLRAQLSPMIGQRLERKTLERIKASVSQFIANLRPQELVPLVNITSARLEGDMLHITINPVPPVEFINVTQMVGGSVPDRLTFAGKHAVGGHSGHGGGLD